VRADADDLMLDDAIAHGLGDAVKDNDSRFPPEWRLSKSARKKDRAGKDTNQKRKD
jgi:enoyl-CoA hydratase